MISGDDLLMNSDDNITVSPRSSIRRRLLVTVFLPVLLACLGLTISSSVITYLYGREAVGDYLESIARVKHNEIQAWTDDLQGELQFSFVGDGADALAVRILQGQASEDEVALFRGHLRRVGDAGRFLEEIFLLDAYGYVVLSTDMESEGLFRGLQDYFRSGLSSSGVYVQTIGATAEELNRVYAVQPVHGVDGSSLGVLCGRSDLERLQNIMVNSSGMGDTSQAFLVADNLVPLSFVESHKYAPGMSYIQSENIISAVNHKDSRTVFGEDYRGVSVIGVYRWIPAIDSVLVVKQDQAEALASLRVTLWTQVGIACIAAIVAVLLSIGLSRGIIRPVKDLAEATRSIALGEFRQRVNVEDKPEEIAELAGAFNAMSSHIQHMFGEIQTSEQRFRNLVETTPDWIWEVDTHGVCAYSSPRVQDVLGYHPEDLYGLNFRDFVPTHQREAYDDVFDGLLKNRKGFNQLQLALLHKDGHQVMMEMSCVAFWSTDGELAGFRGVSRDITRRLKAEAALRDSEEYLRNTLQAIEDAVISTDIEGRVVRMNQRAEVLTEWQEEEAAGKDVNEVLVLKPLDTSHQDFSQYVKEILKTGEPHAHPHNGILVSRQYKRYTVSHRGSPFFDSDGQLIGVVIVVRDVSEEQRMMDRLRHSEKMEAVGQLSGGIAHDFNNLLSGILGNSQLIEMELSGDNGVDGTEELRVLSGEITRAAERAADLTKQLLSFSRKRQNESVPIDLHDTIEDALSMLSRSIDPRIKISKELEAGFVALNGDPTQLENAFLNLGLNARDAMPQGGEIRVSTRNVEITESQGRQYAPEVKAGNYVQVDFSDTGKGIEKEMISHIFEPFFTTKNEFQGTGLGLSSVYACVQAHHGTIRVYSEPGEGTTFRILLPADSDGVVFEKAVENESPIQKFTGSVIVVDDEAVVRRSLERICERLGASVHAFASGKDAIEYFREMYEATDLVILDLVMPDLNGTAVFQALKEIDPEVKVILASGFGKNQAVDKLLEQGVCKFLSKPFNVRELTAALNEIVRS